MTARHRSRSRRPPRSRRRRLRPGILPAPAFVAALPAVVSALLAVAPLSPVEVRGQEVPRAPTGPAPAVTLPPVHRSTLGNGASVLTVPGHEVPLVTVTLVVPGGRAADPPGREGVARLVAELLTRGTISASAGEITERLGALGADLSASAGPDWMAVSVTTLGSTLPDALSLLADVALRPAFPRDALERARRQAAASVASGLRRTDVAADRAFLRTVYGDHPYGRLESPESLAAVERADLQAFHDTWFRPRGALLAVAGDVDPAAVAEQLEGAFGAWSGTAPDVPPLRPIPRAPAGRLPVLLVHLPGASRASLRLGTALVPGSDPAWSVLPLVDRVLGAGPAGVRTVLQRRREWGFFQAALESDPAAAPRAAAALLGLVERLATGFAPPEELRHARAFLVNSFPLQVETAQQVAARTLSLRLLGGNEDLAAAPEAIARLGPQDVRDAVAAHLDPERLVLVVAGDATLLRAPLATVGSVTVVDGEGRPVSLEALAPVGRSVPVDASGLVPLTMTYRVSAAGREVGRMSRALEWRGEDMVYRGAAELAGRQVEQSVTFTVPAFEAVSATALMERPEGRVSLDVRVEDGRLVGTAREGSAPPRALDHPAPRGALLGDMLEVAVMVAPLAEGAEIRLSVLHAGTGAVESVPLVVEGRERVTVPAGAFDAWRVRIGGSEPQRVWVRVDAPRVPVRVEPIGGLAAFELVEVVVEEGR